MAKLIDIVQRESCFQPGSTLCGGCMEAIAFQNIGKVTDNGKKTIFALGTFCGEVSTLQYPSVVSWGRGDTTPNEWTKSLGVMHHVFESAPTVAEGVSDTAALLHQMGAITAPVQVAALSGDGGALAIGLRSLLHTIARGAPITIYILVNEIFANTGFQYSPTASLGTETSTTPISEAMPGNLIPPIDYLGLAITAGAGLVAQVSPAFPKLFYRVIEEAMQCKTTSVIFIPSPCITGWKFPDGETISLARIACETGFFPCFIKAKGQPGELKFVERDPAKRPGIEHFMIHQRRFQHLVTTHPDGTPCIRPEHTAFADTMRTWVQDRLDALQRFTERG